MKNNILFVEENDIIRENVAEWLCLEGYNVIKANCGVKAIELAKQQLPALVVCDIMMNSMDGYAVYKALFKTLYVNKVPFIYVVANVKSKTVNVLSAENYASDAIKERDLLNCVKKCLQSSHNSINSNISMVYKGEY